MEGKVDGGGKRHSCERGHAKLHIGGAGADGRRERLGVMGENGTSILHKTYLYGLRWAWFFREPFERAGDSGNGPCHWFRGNVRFRFAKPHYQCLRQHWFRNTSPCPEESFSIGLVWYFALNSAAVRGLTG